MARSKNKPSYGVLFWIASILLISVLYIANHQNIQRVLDNTRFMEVVFEDSGSDPSEEPVQDVLPDPAVEPVEPAEPITRERSPEEQRQESEPVEEQEGEEEEIILDVPETVPEETARTLSISTFFIRVSDDGRILPEPVQRSIEYTDSPLTRTIESLLDGPNADALNRGLLNLIPEGTVLISAHVEGGVAYLNFNEQFRFNPIGMEGFTAQLQQIVYTATAFSSIQSVQILIEGEVLDYLGGEGIYIGSPLTRNTFRT